MPIPVKDPNVLLRAVGIAKGLRERRDEAKIVYGDDYGLGLYRAAKIILLRQRAQGGTIIANAHALMEYAEQALSAEPGVFNRVVAMYCAAVVELHDGYIPEDSPYAR